MGRLNATIDGTIKIREDKPVSKPDLNMMVAQLPKEFEDARKGERNMTRLKSTSGETREQKKKEKIAQCGNLRIK